MTKTNGRLNPKTIRFIKLGRAGGLEERCINEGICYIGFGTGDSEIFDIAYQASLTGAEAHWGLFGTNSIKGNQTDLNRNVKQQPLRLETKLEAFTLQAMKPYGSLFLLASFITLL
jgi:hypothetical protein